LDSDASQYGLGVVLFQIQNGQEVVIGYYSKSLGKSERNYWVTRKELLAFVKAVEHYHSFLYGRKFLIRSDYAALQWLLNFKNPEGQLARWLEKLQAYDFDLKHRSGRSHANADSWSRRPCCEEHCKFCERQESKNKAETINQIRNVTHEEATATPVAQNSVSREQIVDEQRLDPDLKIIRE